MFAFSWWMPTLVVDVGADFIIDESEKTSTNNFVTVLYGSIYERVIPKFQRQTCIDCLESSLQF